MVTAMSMGPASNSGVVDSLLAKVDAAQVAFARKQPSVAVQLLQTFIQEVEAHKGTHIGSERAISLMTQAQTVINSIVSTKATNPILMKAGLTSLNPASTAAQNPATTTAPSALPLGAFGGTVKR